MRNRCLEKMNSKVRVRISGSNVWRYLRRILKDKIRLIRIIPISVREVEVILAYDEYLKLMTYRSIYEVEVLEYYGRRRWKNRLKKNIFLISFFLLGIILIGFFSRVVSQIEVIHQDREMRNYLINELEKCGLKKYSLKKSYHELEKIEDKILKENKDKLEWIEIIEYGTKYIVRVEERKLNALKNTYQYQHIVSRKNAVIRRIDAFSGEKVKFVNDYVKKGDIIISGEIMMPDNTVVSTMAQGNVYGEVWYQVDLYYPYVYQESKLTGRSKRGYAIYFFNRRMALFDFKHYRTFQTKNKILFSSNLLNIRFVQEKQYETLVKDEIYTDEMVEEKAFLYIKKKLSRDNPFLREIMSIKVLKREEDGEGVKFQLFVNALEEIGEVQSFSLTNDKVQENE